LGSVGFAQSRPTPTITPVPVSPVSAASSPSLPSLKDPATIDQIREYLRLSGDLESYRARWIAAVDKERAVGVRQAWPEPFWTDLKAEVGKTDLMPMFITMYQHGISRELMQEVLDTYHLVGATLFKLSPACFRLAIAQQAMADDTNQLRLAKTLEVTEKVYTRYKPQIIEASDQYLAEHPHSVDK
jgi:hypothetical protein